MEINYRINKRGGSTYILPIVGCSWSQSERDFIKQTLRDCEYFVSVISPGKIVVAETSNSPRIDDLERFI